MAVLDIGGRMVSEKLGKLFGRWADFLTAGMMLIVIGAGALFLLGFLIWVWWNALFGDTNILIRTACGILTAIVLLNIAAWLCGRGKVGDGKIGKTKIYDHSKRGS